MPKTPENKINLIGGEFIAHVGVSDPDAPKIDIRRILNFTQDPLDGAWKIIAMHHDLRHLLSTEVGLFGTGSILVTDPATTEFVTALCTLIVAPNAFGPGRPLSVTKDWKRRNP
jgi:hypothetical protein